MELILSWVKKYPLCVLTGILIVGYSLRHYQLATWPREGATFDEFAWTFLGISLWNTGIPTSWSPHAAYKQKVEYYNPQGAHFVLVTPYLEHPPLFGLIAGGFAKLRGVSSFDQVTIQKIRPLALILGVLSIIAIYTLATSIYGQSIGLLTAFIYAITPTVVVGSRLVQNENFFIPFFLFALYFAYSYIKNPRSLLLHLAALICGLLPLAKVPWIVASMAVIGMFVYSKKWKEAGIVLLTTLLCFSLFLLWGFALDHEVFINLWKLQLARYDMAFDSMFLLFRDPLIADRLFVDGWIYFGWGAMLLLLLQDVKKHMPVTFGFLAYGAIFIFAIPGEPFHGWYRFPFYPFLTIATAVFLMENFKKNNLGMIIFYLFTGLAGFAYGWGRVFGFSYLIYRIYIACVLVNSFPYIFSNLRRYRIFESMRLFLIVLVMFLTVLSTIYYTEL